MKTWILSLLAIFAISTAAQASGPEDPFTKHFNQTKGVAVHGYDVVSYFKGTPVQGNKKFASEHRGVTFYFANQANVDAFDTNPENYIPAYGGWCATAMGMMNQKLDVNPTSFLIQNGQLFLFSTSMGPAKDQWVANLPGVKQNADANWAKIISK